MYIEHRDPKEHREADNIENVYICGTHREFCLLTLTTEESWYPDTYPNILEAPCQVVKDPQTITECTCDYTRRFPIVFQ